MSTSQRMTLIGLYNYENSYERDLFRELALPDGFDKDTFVNSLLLEHGEKCILYTNPQFFADAIGVWSSKYSLELTRIYEALTAEYNPIWNYDRNEEWEDHGGHKLTSSTNAGHKATDSPDFTVAQTVDGTMEHQVSADNSSTYQPDYKDTTSAGTTKTSGKTQDLAETSNSKTEDQATDNTNHSGHMWGNIGVTTAASMVSEVVRQRFNMSLYGVATKLFANELLLGIW